jgi:hypothetical protein
VGHVAERAVRLLQYWKTNKTKLQQQWWETPGLGAMTLKMVVLWEQGTWRRSRGAQAAGRTHFLGGVTWAVGEVAAV